jgi:hypothetical protein
MHYEWAYTSKNHHFLLIEPENAVEVKQDSRRTVTKAGKVTINVRYRGTFSCLCKEPSLVCDSFHIKFMCRDDVRFILKPATKKKPRSGHTGGAFCATAAHIGVSSTASVDRADLPVLIVGSCVTKQYNNNAVCNCLILLWLWLALMLGGWQTSSMLAKVPVSVDSDEQTQEESGCWEQLE